MANGLERSLNISNPLEMPLEMLVCICEFDHCKKSLQSPVRMILEAT